MSMYDEDIYLDTLAAEEDYDQEEYEISYIKQLRCTDLACLFKTKRGNTWIPKSAMILVPHEKQIALASWFTPSYFKSFDSLENL